MPRPFGNTKNDELYPKPIYRHGSKTQKTRYSARSSGIQYQSRHGAPYCFTLCGAGIYEQ